MEFEKRADMPGCLDEIDEKEDLLGYISNMTPMMTSGSKKYFNCHINTKKIRRKGQSASHLKREKSPVKISKFKINWNSPRKDIVINQDTNNSQTTLSDENAFAPVTVPTDSITSLDSLTNAVPEQPITIKTKVFNLTQPKKIITCNKTKLIKQDGTLVEPTGQINVVLWQNQVDSIQEGQTYIFKHIKEKDNPYDTSNYSATVTPEHEDALPEVNVLPNMINQIDAVICEVEKMSFFKACFSCNSKIIEKMAKETAQDAE
ncbi:hypothetical protein pdam_00023853 [Pocillopora damicornis]|uniref:Uncharacterized protein n=1 Tax=Pocillopora damicornis TaxID=46731 RepID=A0A3M6TWL3_POCDA|nr:hypothetical protein pdam_00023853 [Pocillopora damicornis]